MSRDTASTIPFFGGEDAVVRIDLAELADRRA